MLAFRREGQGDRSRGHVAGRARPEISAQHRAGGIQDPDPQAQIRRHEGDLRRDEEVAAACVDPDQVDIVARADDASDGRRETRGERGGLRGIAMIIRERRHA